MTRVVRLWLVPLVMVLVALACSGTPVRMQILDQPVYVCPTATPRPTDTPAPTDMQPPIHLPPSGWATHTPIPGCIWNGTLCATNTPMPGGLYRTPGFSLPGLTSTPRPTNTPYPPPTPFVMRPPEAFYVDDPIYAGGFSSPIQARFRLMDVQTHRSTPDASGQSRQIVVWSLEVKNVGNHTYELFPAWQMYVNTVVTAAGEVEGVWGASRDAAIEVGLADSYEATALTPGETRIFSLAAYIPAGIPNRFTFALDPTQHELPGMPGTNLLIWANSANTVCAGEITYPGVGDVLPTPLR